MDEAAHTAFDDIAIIVLCGGTSRRFGGTDKTAARFGHSTVLGQLLDELPPGRKIVCVGERRPTPRPVTWVRETPPRGGPVAGIAAGMTQIDTPYVAVIAGDMPYAARALSVLVEALIAHPRAGAALAEDPDGNRQMLLSVYRADPLRSAIPEDSADVAVRRVITQMDVVTVPVEPDAAADIDTQADLRRLSDSQAPPRRDHDSRQRHRNHPT